MAEPDRPQMWHLIRVQPGTLTPLYLTSVSSCCSGVLYPILLEDNVEMLRNTYDLKVMKVVHADQAISIVHNNHKYV